MMLDAQTAGSKRTERGRRAYSFARAGHLWTPERRQCIAGGVGGSFAARGLGAGRGDPRMWPGASGLEAYYRWNLGTNSDFDSRLNPGVFGSTAINWSGTMPLSCALQVEIHTDASHFRWSADNGANWSADLLIAASVLLPNGVTLLFSGTYTVGRIYYLTRARWADQKNTHHFDTLGAAGTPRNPTPLVTPYGTFVHFDGDDDILICSTALAANVVNGTAKAFYILGVAYINATTPPLTDKGTLLFFGDGATTRTHMWYHSDLSGTLTHRSLKTDDGGTNAIVSGGTPNTSIHTFALDCSGTTVTIRIDGVQVATGAQAPGTNALTCSMASLGKSFIGGAEGNPGNISWGELAIYSTRPSAGIQADNEQRMRATTGF